MPRQKPHKASRQSVFQGLWNNSLSIVFFSLFALALLGQSLTGLAAYNNVLIANHRQPISYRAYLRTGDFLDGVFCNWQAAILQLACLIVFSEAFRQKGAAHSRKPESRGQGHGGGRSWAYRNSLSLAFAGLFLFCFIAHLIFGGQALNASRALLGQTPLSLGTYLMSSDFWFKTAQTWQAEFGSIGTFIVLSIFLRQQGSAESKPVESSDRSTGQTNK